MRITGFLAITGALVALTAAPAPALQNNDGAPATDRTHGLTAAQATTLQHRVDRVVTRTGGVQVAINRVVWEGGDTLVPLPGERRARELGASRLSQRGTIHGCKYLQFCTYTGDDYTGMLDRMQSCTLHITHGWFRSYVNNQTRGTRARFLLANKQRLSSTKPAPAKGTTSLGLTTYYIRPC